MRIKHSSQLRAAFTLVELLVAATLTVVIMAIMATAFQVGMDTLSQLKSVASLSQQLRAAEVVLRRDLMSQHLEDSGGNPLLLSDFTVGTSTVPGKGYFRFVQNSVPNAAGANYFTEGADSDGTPSSRATDHILGMTVKLTGASPWTIFTTPMSHVPPAPVPATTVTAIPLPSPFNSPQLEVTPTSSPLPNTLAPPQNNSIQNFNALGSSNRIDFVQKSFATQPPAAPNLPPAPFAQTNVSYTKTFASNWAEVNYFLGTVPTGTTNANSSGISFSTFTLYRRERLLISSNIGKNNKIATLPNQLPGLSTAPLGAPNNSTLPGSPPTVFPNLNSPIDVVDPRNRFGGAAAARSAAEDPSHLVTQQTDFLSPMLNTQGAFSGDDILLSNVVSFQVQGVMDPGTTSPATVQTTSVPGSYVFADINPPPPSPPNPPPTPNPLTGLKLVYDTWGSGIGNSPTPLVQTRLRAVQIKIRVYDPKNKVTRQMTVTQDL
ncbi:hypothetical protein [Fimbriiglobus ruber]|uniref:Prepilin-type N-terminal cleavage/methylation domain-containing protein n=1 Tax=Fimbriiglobus ruber TaxID=1908690 RepID=A0A225E296_9BACT|nr:hypothetical protein [Fimbriiglobus ruber]OWK43609.1 hypothetical protein FRUB_03208 [Fimbriiglobus ruber]